MQQCWPRVFGVSGYSGSGKTTLIERVLPILQTNGLRVAVIKHLGHGTRREADNTDTARLARCGATVLACTHDGVIAERTEETGPSDKNGLRRTRPSAASSTPERHDPKIAACNTIPPGWPEGLAKAVRILGEGSEDGKGYDLVLVEGFKNTPMVRVWLLAEKDQPTSPAHESGPPPNVAGVLATLPWNDETRPQQTARILQDWLSQHK